jgi:hypothetical protein
LWHTVRSLAVYDLVANVLRRRPTEESARHRAFDAPLALWRRVLGFEGCAVQFDCALCARGLMADVPIPLRRMLREATGTALHRGIMVHDQLAEVAALATTHDVRVLALKGAARLLGGELAGTRSIGDIDLLVSPPDAARFHSLLQNELGYGVSGSSYPHHLPGLTRSGSLGIEVHFRLSRVPLALDVAIWRDTRSVALGGHPIELPSPTSLVLHTLEHAAGLNWAGRYRLRDIADIAALFTGAVSSDVVMEYVHASPMRAAFETLLSAAHELEPRVPRSRAHAWRTVRRVSRARIAVATLPRSRLVAERCYRYAGLVAEGSPRTLARAGLALVRRLGAAASATVLLLSAGCSDPTGSHPLDVPPFVFVSDAEGIPALFRFDRGQIVRLSAPGHEDVEPHSAAGRIVFTSWRDGNAEIYIGDLGLTGQQRLTSDVSVDNEPALDPSGTTIAFVSSRSGTPRIWLMAANGTNPRPLDTGSPVHVPEGSPAWSPSGGPLAFASTRTNTSQVFLVGTTGGDAVQLTHEASGAFTPTWSADGNVVLYMALAAGPKLVAVPAGGGEPTAFAFDSGGLGEAACTANVCLAVSRPLDTDGDLVALSSSGQASQAVLVRPADDRQPAFLVP